MKGKNGFLKVFAFLFLLMAIVPAFSMKAEAVAEPYVVFDSNDNSLTFYCKNLSTRSYGRSCTVIKLADYCTNGNLTEDISENVTTVTFDSTFQKYQPTTTKCWFAGFSNLTKINNLQNLDTSKVTDMSEMFYGCSKLSQLDLSCKEGYAPIFVTSQVENMDSMFCDCINLTKLNVSDFDTANVKSMANMFKNCRRVTDLYLDDFNTSKVTDMSGMFFDCQEIRYFYVRGFDTSNVTNMANMFHGCTKLFSIDLTKFNTKKVKSFAGMFAECTSVAKLDLSSFSTKSLTDDGCISYMFKNDSLLETIYVSDLWVPNEQMIASKDTFIDCTSLVGGKGFHYDSVWRMGGWARIDDENHRGLLTLKTYKVTFAGTKDSTGTLPDPIYQAAGRTITLPKSELVYNTEGYEFAGWVYDNVTYKEGSTFTMPAYAVKFTASFKAKEKYTVRFSGGEGVTGSVPANKKGYKGDSFKLPQNPFTKSGYKFTGWNDGTKTYQPNDTYVIPGQNVTMTAVWSKIYKITFEGGEGATGDAPRTIKEAAGLKVVLPMNTFEKYHFKFTGWSDGNNTYASGSEFTMPGKNVKLTAVWKYKNSDVPEAPASKIKATKSVNDFINRCYKVALGREADEIGYNYWLEKINNEQLAGAQIGYGFIFSDEYIGRNKTNKQYLNDLYAMYFGREADEEGYAYWMNKLENGESRESVFAGFANSDEFFNLCAKYGITRGYYITGYDLEAQGKINCFVARLYKVCFNRLPDKDGQIYWTEKLVNGEETGTSVVKSMIQSNEFVNLNLDDDNYVAYLYRAIFGRNPGKEEFNYWVKFLVTGEKSRDDVLNEFVKSNEFVDMCNNYGIKQ